MIEIKTLSQSLKSSHIQSEDMDLQSHCNDGWEIVNITVGPETSTEYANRYVTLKRDVNAPAPDAPAPTKPLDGYSQGFEDGIQHERNKQERPSISRPIQNELDSLLIPYIHATQKSSEQEISRSYHNLLSFVEGIAQS